MEINPNKVLTYQITSRLFDKILYNHSFIIIAHLNELNH